MTDDDRDGLDAGIKHAHQVAIAAGETAERAEQLVIALVHVLVSRGAIDPGELDALVPWPETTADKHQVASPDIDCQALLPVCRARCCRLTIQLSKQDIADGLDWVFERPYELRRDAATGYCTSFAAGCQIYDKRPAGCRTFDCRDDRRIWIDFAQRIPAAMELTDPVVQIRRRKRVL